MAARAAGADEKKTGVWKTGGQVDRAFFVVFLGACENFHI
jgi:hypothetical protein